ncbi:hypothetical protein FB451DRAFT_1384439 [Mycena latifolia]|nr:hypothetical protein FB451DRAFT_1384439 [Mycena latifolia]
MRLLALPLAFLLLSLLPSLFAAPASVTPDEAEGSSTSASASTLRQSTPESSTPAELSTTAGTRTTSPPSRKPTATTKHRVVTPTTKNGQITLRPGNPSPTIPASPPSRSHTHPPNHSHSQPVAALVLEILGALAGCIFLLSLMRCIYSYNRTPARDRITAILHRHQLQREMEELERHPPNHRASLVEPPPPYVAPPPSYPAVEETSLSRQHSFSSAQETHGQLSPLRPNG